MTTIVNYLKQAVLCTILMLFSFSIGLAQDNENNHKPETDLHPEIFWDVKAYRPEAQLLKVKGIDKNGKMHDVKAIQYSEDTSLLDVKLLMNGQRLPIKLIDMKGEAFHPLKGIDKDGNLIDIKAVTDDGEILDVKGVSKTGNVIHIRAVADYGLFYNIISIAPNGKVNNVKGLKMLSTKIEGVINGVPIFAHVKSMQQD
ncbi:DUF7486 family protein [Winogradskyella vincentii]|uniref:DUF7486 domain-containing protein n=1 Tax=Winogradskyella vincentii TaxID=2877122 RepID=A0ABS7XZI4_9FLAO|nr:hypothetical protein [Winogradskyella vincentii]MCA0153052.1 hypothetical protein [Winogradskyella vincentii]